MNLAPPVSVFAFENLVNWKIRSDCPVVEGGLFILLFLVTTLNDNEKHYTVLDGRNVRINLYSYKGVSISKDLVG